MVNTCVIDASRSQKVADALFDKSVTCHKKSELRAVLEVDFVCNKGYRRYYIQTALAMPDDIKAGQELASLRKIDDGFRKFIILGTPTPRYQNDYGITIMNVYDFLLDADSLNA